MLNTLYDWSIAKAYLKGSSLPHATMACRAARTAVQLGSVHKWVAEGNILAVFLMLLGVGEVGTLKSSTWKVAARLGILNSKIPSLSKSHKTEGSAGK